MQRREFLGKAASALFAGVAVQILGCSDSANYANGLGSGPGGAAVPGSDVEALIAAPDTPNHPVSEGRHIAIITKAEISKGKYLILSIKGDARHEHTISLSEAEQRDIANGIQVSKPSTDANNHNHTVTFN